MEPVRVRNVDWDRRKRRKGRKGRKRRRYERLRADEEEMVIR
jgi:hypothetical protein